MIISNYDGIDITLDFDFIHAEGNAIKFRINGPMGDISQSVWIPRTCMNDNYDEFTRDMDWFWNKTQNQHKLELAGY